MSVMWRMTDNCSEDSFLESGLSFKVGWVRRGPACEISIFTKEIEAIRLESTIYLRVYLLSALDPLWVYRQHLVQL